MIKLFDVMRLNVCNLSRAFDHPYHTSASASNNVTLLWSTFVYTLSYHYHQVRTQQRYLCGRRWLHQRVPQDPDVGYDAAVGLVPMHVRTAGRLGQRRQLRHGTILQKGTITVVHFVDVTGGAIPRTLFHRNIALKYWNFAQFWWTSLH